MNLAKEYVARSRQADGRTYAVNENTHLALKAYIKDRIIYRTMNFYPSTFPKVIGLTCAGRKC